MALRFIVIFLTQLFIRTAFPAACCGTGIGLPNLVIGDYQAQVMLTGSNAASTHYADPEGAITESDEQIQRVTEMLKLQAGYMLTPLWQTGLSLPVIMNTSRTEQSSEVSRGLGDASAQIAYEFLPEYRFSYWRPRGFVFFNQTLPLAKSTYDAKRAMRTDALGNGFYSSSLGVALVKNLMSFDTQLLLEYHRGFKRRFASTEGELVVTPQGGYSSYLGFGYSPGQGSWRFGTSAAYVFEAAPKIAGMLNEAQDRYYWELGLNTSYLLDSYALSLGYSDQTFFGKAQNTLLSQTLMLSMSKFFEL